MGLKMNKDLKNDMNKWVKEKINNTMKTYKDAKTISDPYRVALAGDD